MNNRQPAVLLLALGNDLLGDDGVGLAAARALQQEFSGRVEVVETGEAGLALMEVLMGYECALIIDAVVTGDHPPGTVLNFAPDDFRRVLAPSPHYAGIPEVLELAARLGVAFPRDIRVLAMEVLNPLHFSPDLTPEVQAALPAYIDSIRSQLESWGG